MRRTNELPHIMASHCRSSLLLITMLIVSACGGPSVKRFDVKEPVLCEGETAVIQWEADGKVAMTFRPEPPRIKENDCAIEGFETFAFTLVAQKDGDEAIKTIEVGRVSDGATIPIALQTTAVADTDVIATQTSDASKKDSALWPDRLKVNAVTACRHRTIHVRHEDKEITLSDDGSPSAGLAGTFLRGSWELRSPLTVEEQQTPALRPKILEIVATVRCREDKNP